MKENRAMSASFLIIDASCSTTILAAVLPERHMTLIKTFPDRKEPGENLLVTVEQWFESEGISIREIDYFATSHGPGSLTGLRVAASFIRTLAQLLQKPVITLNSLWLLEQSSESLNHSCLTIIQARNDRYYVRRNDTVGRDDYQLLTGTQVFEYGKSTRSFTLEEKCDIYRRFPDEFIDKEYVFKAIDPLRYIELVKNEISEKRHKYYTEVTLHYGGQTVAEEVFYRKRGSML